MLRALNCTSPLIFMCGMMCMECMYVSVISIRPRGWSGWISSTLSSTASSKKISSENETEGGAMMHTDVCKEELNKPFEDGGLRFNFWCPRSGSGRDALGAGENIFTAVFMSESSRSTALVRSCCSGKFMLDAALTVWVVVEGTGRPVISYIELAFIPIDIKMWSVDTRWRYDSKLLTIRKACFLCLLVYCLKTSCLSAFCISCSLLVIRSIRVLWSVESFWPVDLGEIVSRYWPIDPIWCVVLGTFCTVARVAAPPAMGFFLLWVSWRSWILCLAYGDLSRTRRSCFVAA